MTDTPLEQRTISEIAQDIAEYEDSFPSRLVPHRHFEAAKRTFLRFYRSYRIFLMVGLSGVGKDALSEEIVREINVPILDTCDKVRAVMVTAPSAQGRAFSMRDLWQDVSVKLDEPLVDQKVDLDTGTNHLLGEGRVALTPAQRKSKSAHDLKNIACRAAIDRKLRLLVINEAFAIVKTESGVTLKEQLDVLRNLADEAPFRIALISTGRILGKFQASGELARRLGIMHFPHYGSPLGTNGRRVSHPDPVAARKAHLGVFVSLQSELPERSRLKPTPNQLEDLYELTLGCAGHLVAWFRWAIVHCDDAGRDQLTWRDFRETVLRENSLNDLRKQRDECESKLQALCKPPRFSAPDPSPDDDPDPPRGAVHKKPVSRRKGVPKPTRYGKLRDAKLDGNK